MDEAGREWDRREGEGRRRHTQTLAQPTHAARYSRTHLARLHIHLSLALYLLLIYFLPTTKASGSTILLGMRKALHSISTFFILL